MNPDPAAAAPQPRPYRILDLNFISLYIQDYPAAVEFYSRVFGPPDSVAEQTGWQLGATWLTVFPGSAVPVVPGAPGQGENPRNIEFAIQMARQSTAERRAKSTRSTRRCCLPGRTRAWRRATPSCTSQCDSAAWTILSACGSTSTA